MNRTKMFNPVDLSMVALPYVYPGTDLTPKEIEVVQGYVDGLNNRQIAEQMGISWQTVKNYGSAIRIKLGAVNRTQAAMAAIGSGYAKCSNGSERSNDKP